MSHTLPDYTTKYKLASIFAHIDEAELAARLGSINYFDRRGNIIFMDDFENTPIKWVTSTSGAGAAVALSTVTARSGSSSIKLTSGTTISKFAGIYKRLILPPNKKIGYEFSFVLSDNIDHIDFYVWVQSLTKIHKYWVRLDPIAKTVALLQSGGLYPVVGSFNELYVEDTTFHTVKLIVDEETGYFKTLIIDDTVFDLSSYAAVTVNVANPCNVYLTINLVGDGVANGYLYVDDVIVTQNEP